MSINAGPGSMQKGICLVRKCISAELKDGAPPENLAARSELNGRLANLETASTGGGQKEFKKFFSNTPLHRKKYFDKLCTRSPERVTTIFENRCLRRDS